MMNNKFERTTQVIEDARCATNRFFQVLGNIHDLESYNTIENAAALYSQLFTCHWAHLAVKRYKASQLKVHGRISPRKAKQ